MKELFDVAVIGAGMAGILAARDLSQKGHSVVLLEGRDRVGGRTFTTEAFGTELELGGTYVHWTHATIWHELQRHGIPIIPPLDSEKAYWLADHDVHSGTINDYYEAVNPLMSQFVHDARSQFPMPFNVSASASDVDQQSLEDRIISLNLSAYERDVLEGAMSGLVHSYREQGVAQLLQGVSGTFGDYNGFFETASFWHIEGGTKRLANAMMSESTATLRLQTPIQSISDNGSLVTVTTRAGEIIHSRFVISAMPINTLGDITIKPELPAPVQSMIDSKNPVMASKIYVRAKGTIEPFNAFAPAGKSPINAARVESRYEGDTLIMCICSDAAAIQANDHAAVQDALRKFVPDIEVVDTASHDWGTDEFSQGGWGWYRPGKLTGAAPLMRQPHGRIFFAGSDIASLGAGFIEGAMQTGVVAAREVASALVVGE
ncbi:amine oxidase [Aspergillus nomiae NRRL 13137]|uniref:Amine oxidase n=1 Tax=Aspergillus nomiae NRRL (strain ATCC 15546 / NRRL 13137 / CBS 260.88 / M93) TaxID=1509407 RepID=A0A0L1IPV4_ASPN3|nr:amine oxidase [Aspergillus nomiae NRRL 13137]KNG81375.1 amine oxidase [Aspergillus nomiae NRRL 13137]